MAQFDPRRQPMRLAPHLLTTAAAVGIALVAGQAYEPVRAEEVPALTSEQMAYLETQAYAAAGAPTGLTAPEAIPVQIRRGETFEQAVRRTGIGADEAVHFQSIHLDIGVDALAIQPSDQKFARGGAAVKIEGGGQKDQKSQTDQDNGQGRPDGGARTAAGGL